MLTHYTGMASVFWKWILFSFLIIYFFGPILQTIFFLDFDGDKFAKLCKAIIYWTSQIDVLIATVNRHSRRPITDDNVARTRASATDDKCPPNWPHPVPDSTGWGYVWNLDDGESIDDPMRM